MTATNATIAVPPCDAGAGGQALEAHIAGASAMRGEWVERCRASIFAKDPLLDAADILDLANTLWERPSCRGVLPEVAADFLFAQQLGSLR